MLISINGKITNTEDGGISPTSEAFLYGYGAFETIKFKGEKIHFLKEHYGRLKAACDTLQIPLEYDLPQIEEISNDLIKASGIKEGGLKILWGKNHQMGDLLLTAAENKYKPHSYQSGFKLTFTDIKRNPHSILTYIKSNNYLENLLARKEAVGRGFDEVIFENLNDMICEGAISNLFWVKEGIIYTPHKDCGLLEGIMRNHVIELAQQLQIPLEKGEYKRGALLEAEELFVTNSLMEIMPVVQLEGRRLNIIDGNQMTKRLMEAIGVRTEFMF